MSYTILQTKTVDGVAFNLAKVTEMSYFSPSGKARLKVKVSYQVELANPPMSDEDDASSQGAQTRQRFWITSKSEALKYFKSL